VREPVASQRGGHDDRRRLLIERQLQNGKPTPLPAQASPADRVRSDIDPLVADPDRGLTYSVPLS
jgi:hypothetical protein